MKTQDVYNYGIVIDSGSSGSRIQIYRWEDPSLTRQSNDNQHIQSPPKITQEKDWALKVTPGISKYNHKTSRIWTDHYSQLLQKAEAVIPIEKHKDTPIFVLSTAGMRLLPAKEQQEILKETCASIRRHTSFSLPNCHDHVQIIDGKTEGMYGWLGLNYLMGQFDNYEVEAESHESIGFMDMGGASTQIAFVPSDKEDLEKHREDLSVVALRNINGDTQKWHVFVETWLGFGANEARSRFLTQLIELSSYGPRKEEMKPINDPCLPKGATLNYEYKGSTYPIVGQGHYEQCLKSIYPLLLKNIPCDDEPCLFNGIHSPKLNFDKDKFIGISEYWYTANDIFQSGGEYNYHKFNEKVKEYCESDWSQVLENSKNGMYSGLDPDTFLKDACFKANWVLNILHEGFELPRLGLEVDDSKIPDEEKAEEDKILNVHVPFKSTDSVNGEELSWTLGRIILFASSQIESNNNDIDIGIYPSEISGKSFISGGGSSINYDSDVEDNASHYGLFILILFFFLFAGLYHFKKSAVGKFFYKCKKFGSPIKHSIVSVGSKIPIIDKLTHPYEEIYQQNDMNVSLEEGLMNSTSTSPKAGQVSSVLRTRSNINLNEDEAQHYELFQMASAPQLPQKPPTPHGLSASRSFNNFMNKPFVVPKRNASTTFYSYSENNSRESLGRVPSSANKWNAD